MNDINQRLIFAEQLAKEAGQLALEYFSKLNTLTIISKGVQDMASEADVNTEKFIRKAIVSQYPEDDFFGEESSSCYVAKTGQGIWVVDPIDGTQPFVNGIPSWCISIAYLYKNEIVLGVIYDPNVDEIFSAQVGKGATLNGNSIKASEVKGVTNGLVSVGYSNRIKPEDTLEPLGRLIRAQGMYHRNGSGALSLAYVAAGRLIGFFELHMNSWDCAAGYLLIREAGGKVNNILAVDEFLTKGSPVIAAADGVYDDLFSIIYNY